MSKNYLKTFLIFAAVLLVVLIPTKAAHAGIIGDLIGDFSLWALAKAVWGINYIIGFIGGVLLWLAGGLVNWSLDLNNQVLNSEIVKIGWVISRDLANLGFVLTIILIAFATILRFETYGAKKLLSRLIIAALLVNFSLVIAGAFIDFSGVLTNFFINSSITDPAQFASALASSLQPQKLFEVPDSGTPQAPRDNFGDAIVIIASLFFNTALTLVSAMSLLAVAFMFINRFISLTILLILMPLAWLAWIIPDFETHWKTWWSKFFKWIWFAPMASFFIYLALKIGTSGAGITHFNPPPGGGNFGLTLKNITGNIGQMIAVIGVLLGGLKISQEMGSGLAKSTIERTEKAGGWLAGRPGAAARWGAGRVLGTGAKPGEGTALQRASARFSGTPILGGIARNVNSWASSTAQKQQGNFEKELSALDKLAFVNTGKSLRRMSDPLFVSAYAKVAAEKGGYIQELKKPENEAILGQVMDAARRSGSESALLAKDPTLAKIGRTDKSDARIEMKKALGKIKPSDATDFSKDLLEDIDLVSLLSKAQMEELMKKGNREKINSLKSTFFTLQEAIKQSQNQPPADWNNLDPLIKNLYKSAEEWSSAVAKQKSEYDSSANNIKAEYENDLANLESTVRENMASVAAGTSKKNKGGRGTAPESLPPARIEVVSRFVPAK